MSSTTRCRSAPRSTSAEVGVDGRGRPAAGKPARVAKLSSMSERTALPAVSADELELSPAWEAALEGYERELTRRGQRGRHEARLRPRPAGARRPGRPGAGASPASSPIATCVPTRRRSPSGDWRARAWRASSPRCAAFTRTWSPAVDNGANPADLLPAQKRATQASAGARAAMRSRALLDRIPARTPLEVRDRALFELAYSSRAARRGDRLARARRRRLRVRGGARHRQGLEDAPGADRRAGPARPAPLRRDGAARARRRRREETALFVSPPRTPALALRRAPPAREVGPRGGGRRAASRRTRCATPSPPICSRAAPICARSRSCWDTRACRRPRSTRGSSLRACAESTQSLTRARERARIAFKPARGLGSGYGDERKGRRAP